MGAGRIWTIGLCLNFVALNLIYIEFTINSQFLQVGGARQTEEARVCVSW